MFTDIFLIIAAVVYPVVMAAGMTAAFKLGRGDKRADILPPVPVVRKRPVADPDALLRAQIFENAMNYDGTAQSQKAVGK